MKKLLQLIGYGSGIAANNPDCALGPWYLYYHPALLQSLTLTPAWETIIKASSPFRGAEVLSAVEESLSALSKAVYPLATQKKEFCVIGGDHASGIGTWSAVAAAHRSQGDIGLIWIDAHLDSHTPETSLTQNIHGMPLAHLLGIGLPNLCQISDHLPKLKPQNLCLIGIRSYEPEEQQLLERLGVTIYYMQDIQARGLEAVLAEASTQVSATTCGFGISIDMDAIDPEDAPGVGYREPDGIYGSTLLAALRTMPNKQQLLGLEIAEFNPMRDEANKTARLLVQLIEAVYAENP